MILHPEESDKQHPFQVRGRREDAPPLTLTLLLSMCDMPLRRAAEKVGVSVSYLKRACRRLGISCWPRAGRSISTAGTTAANGPTQVNIAYSRQLYRKYGTGEERTLTSKSTASRRRAEQIYLEHSDLQMPTNLHHQQAMPLEGGEPSPFDMMIDADAEGTLRGSNAHAAPDMPCHDNIYNWGLWECESLPREEHGGEPCERAEGIADAAWPSDPVSADFAAAGAADPADTAAAATPAACDASAIDGLEPASHWSDVG